MYFSSMPYIVIVLLFLFELRNGLESTEVVDENLERGTSSTYQHSTVSCLSQLSEPILSTNSNPHNLNRDSSPKGKQTSVSHHPSSAPDNKSSSPIKLQPSTKTKAHTDNKVIDKHPFWLIPRGCYSESTLSSLLNNNPSGTSTDISSASSLIYRVFSLFSYPTYVPFERPPNMCTYLAQTLMNKDIKMMQEDEWLNGFLITANFQHVIRKTETVLLHPKDKSLLNERNPSNIIIPTRSNSDPPRFPRVPSMDTFTQDILFDFRLFLLGPLVPVGEGVSSYVVRLLCASYLSDENPFVKQMKSINSYLAFKLVFAEKDVDEKVRLVSPLMNWNLERSIYNSLYNNIEEFPILHENIVRYFGVMGMPKIDELSPELYAHYQSCPASVQLFSHRPILPPSTLPTYLHEDRLVVRDRTIGGVLILELMREHLRTCIKREFGRGGYLSLFAIDDYDVGDKDGWVYDLQEEIENVMKVVRKMKKKNMRNKSNKNENEIDSDLIKVRNSRALSDGQPSHFNDLAIPKEKGALHKKSRSNIEIYIDESKEQSSSATVSSPGTSAIESLAAFSIPASLSTTKKEKNLSISNLLSHISPSKYIFPHLSTDTYNKANGWIAMMLGQILHGLSYLHSREYLHRDIKPENILIEPTFLCHPHQHHYKMEHESGGQRAPCTSSTNKGQRLVTFIKEVPLKYVAKLCDFGMALKRFAVDEEDQNYQFEVLTTLQYRSPEAILGIIDSEQLPSMDLFSVAQVFYEFYSGGETLFKELIDGEDGHKYKGSGSNLPHNSHYRNSKEKSVKDKHEIEINHDEIEAEEIKMSSLLAPLLFDLFGPWLTTAIYIMNKSGDFVFDGDMNDINLSLEADGTYSKGEYGYFPTENDFPGISHYPNYEKVKRLCESFWTVIKYHNAHPPSNPPLLSNTSKAYNSKIYLYYHPLIQHRILYRKRLLIALRKMGRKGRDLFRKLTFLDPKKRYQQGLEVLKHPFFHEILKVEV